MGEARMQNQWAHTSSVLALIANVNRDSRKARAFKPADFNPHAPNAKSKTDDQKPMADIRMLKQIFVDPAPTHRAKEQT